MQEIAVLSCVPKKEPKKGTLGICLLPSLTAMKRARVTALFLFIADVTAQLDRESSPPHLVFLCISVVKNKNIEFLRKLYIKRLKNVILAFTIKPL
ncbi:MAG: hypothetical protein COB41_03565 [Proteobacteria bacterium]|nr:MAG: hypothetical protein COB41_03565 [Pseudomonadota bacterium]